MTPKLNKLIEQLDHRALRDDELQKILAFSLTMPKRVAAVTNLEKIEEEAVTAALTRLKARYPALAKQHARAWDKAHRDLQLVLRYCAFGALLDAPEYIEERLLVWMRTMLSAGGMAPGLVKDTYSFLKEEVARRLSEEDFSYLEAQLTTSIETLSDFPEPAVSRV